MVSHQPQAGSILCVNAFCSPPPSGMIRLHCREQKEQLSRECAKEVFLVQKAIAADYRADPAMAAACKEDVERYCKDVKEGGGRKAACLVSGGRWLLWTRAQGGGVLSQAECGRWCERRGEGCREDGDRCDCKDGRVYVMLSPHNDRGGLQGSLPGDGGQLTDGEEGAEGGCVTMLGEVARVGGHAHTWCTFC
jgi:hypothetical protein